MPDNPPEIIFIITPYLTYGRGLISFLIIKRYIAKYTKGGRYYIKKTKNNNHEVLQPECCSGGGWITRYCRIAYIDNFHMLQ